MFSLVSASSEVAIDTWLLVNYVQASCYLYASTHLTTLCGLPDSFSASEHFRSFIESRPVFTIRVAEVSSKLLHLFSVEQWTLWVLIMRKKKNFLEP